MNQKHLAHNNFKWRDGDHEWRNIDGAWELHYMPVDSGTPVRYGDEFDAPKLNAIARLTLERDHALAALKSLVSLTKAAPSKPYETMIVDAAMVTPYGGRYLKRPSILGV